MVESGERVRYFGSVVTQQIILGSDDIDEIFELEFSVHAIRISLY